MSRTSKKIPVPKTKATKIYDVPRNTIRDYIVICELKIIDADKYKTVVQQATGEKGKASVKSIEKRCRVALGEYRAQANKMKAEGKLLPFYPNEDFYNAKKKCLQNFRYGEKCPGGPPI